MLARMKSKGHNPLESSFVKRVARNALFFFSSQIWEAIAGLAIVAILARYLGIEGFGSYAVVFSVVNLVVPLTFMGIQQVGIREIASKEDDSEKATYLGSLLQARIFLLCVAAFVIALILLAMRPEKHVIFGVIIFFFAIVIGSSGEVIISSFIAGEKFQYHLFVVMVERLSLLVFVAMVALLDVGFYAVFLCYVAAKSLKTSCALYFLKKNFYSIIFSFDVGWIKMIIKESYLIGFGISIGVGFHHAIVIILKQFVGLQAAGIFTAYYNLILRCQLLSVSLSRSLMPRISIEAKRNVAAYLQLVKKGMLLLLIGGGLLALMIWPLKGFIISTIYGKPFLLEIKGFGYLVLLLPILFVDNILNVAFISKRLAKSFFFAKVSGLLVGVALTVGFVSDFQLYSGIYGIINGKLFSTLIMLLIFRRYVASALGGLRRESTEPDPIDPKKSPGEAEKVAVDLIV